MAGRDALLEQINFGIKLRPTKTADKSQPVIQAEGEKFKQYIVPSAASEQQQSSYSVLPNMVLPPPAPPPPPPFSSSCIQKIVSTGQHNRGESQKPSSQSSAKIGQQRAAAVDRDALLDEIRSGVKLKKVKTDEKSVAGFDNATQPIRQGVNRKASNQRIETDFIQNNSVKNVGTIVAKQTDVRPKIVPDSRQALMDQINHGVSLRPVQTMDKPSFKVNVAESTANQQKLAKSQQESENVEDRPGLLRKSSNDGGFNQSVHKPNFAESKENSPDIRNPKEDLPKYNMILELQKDLNKRNANQNDYNQSAKISSLPPTVLKKPSLQHSLPATSDIPLSKLNVLKSNLHDLPDKDDYFKTKSVPCVLVAENQNYLPPININSTEKKTSYHCKPIIVAAAIDSRVENQCNQNQASFQRQVSQETKQNDQPEQQVRYEMVDDNLQSLAKEFAEFLKQKLDQHPQPNYPLKNPVSQDQDLRQLLSLALSCTAQSSSSKEIQPPTIAPPPIPPTETLPSSNVRKDSEWLNNGNVVKAITKALERKASVGQLQNATPPNGHQESSVEPLDNTVKSAYAQNGGQFAFSNGHHDAQAGGKIDLKDRVRKLSVGNLTNFLQNHSSSNGTTSSQPREHVIEVKRIPVHSSEFAKGSIRQTEFADENGSGFPRQNVSGSKTLPRRMHNAGGGSFSEQISGAAIHQTPFHQATLRTLPLDLGPPIYVRHNSDPNLLDSEDSGIDAEFSLFRKVFPKVSQLRNHFETDNKSDDGSSNKSSPSNPYPSHTFVCKPAMGIPIPPTTGTPQLSVMTKFDDKSSRVGGQPMRRMSSASESSSYSSSDLSSPRSGGGKRPEYYVASTNGVIKNSNAGDNNYANGRSNGHHYNGQNQQSHAPVYTARPVFMNGPSIKQQQQQHDAGDQNRCGQSTAAPPVSTWKVRKDSVPQTVHQYSIAKTLEDMHHRRFDSENSSESGNGDRQMVNGMTFDDRMDSEVARLVGLTLEDMKQMRFQIDLQDPQGILLQLQKRMQHPH